MSKFKIVKKLLVNGEKYMFFYVIKKLIQYCSEMGHWVLKMRHSEPHMELLRPLFNGSSGPENEMLRTIDGTFKAGVHGGDWSVG